jgi:small-conductance mechanosensitive channel
MIGSLIQVLHQWHGIWRFLAVLAAGLAIGLAVKAIAFRILRRLAGRTKTTLDDEIVEGLRWPARLIVLSAALRWAIADLDERDLPASAEVWLGRLLVVLIWAAVTSALTRVAVAGLIFWFRSQPDAREVTTLARTAVAMVCSIPALFGLLNAFDVNIAPALTALGVGGIAVSLALKDTLANLFSGFYVSLAGNLRKGDYIRIDGGYEGWVEDIRWRITTIRTLGGNLIVLPNSRLSEAVVTNFSQPESPMSVLIPVHVSYASDIDAVERVVLEEARKGMGDIEGLMEKPAPVLRLNPGFGEFGLEMTLVVHVTRYELQFAVTDLLRRRLLKRFRREGIEIPFPRKPMEPPGEKQARS